MKKLILLPCFILLSGCAASTHYLQTGAKTYAAESPAKVRVFAGEPGTAKYEVIGSVAVDKLGEGNEVTELLKEEAAKMGANGVIHVHPTKMSSFTSRSGLSGVAVRLVQ